MNIARAPITPTPAPFAGKHTEPDFLASCRASQPACAPLAQDAESAKEEVPSAIAILGYN